MVTAYWVKSESPATLRGSTRTPDPLGIVRLCVFTSAPSMKRRHSSDAPVAVTVCNMIGVVQPPNVRVTFGRKYFAAGCASAVYPIAVEGLNTLTAAAIVPCAADATNEYSPSARHPAVAAAPQSALAATPFWKRGSNAHAAPAAVIGPVNAVGGPPPSGVNVSAGATEAVPRF